MKLPLSFGNRLFLRLLLPGAILALGLLPAILYLIGESSESITIFGLATLGSGWFLTIFDLPIYMLFEGRRFWPNWLRNKGIQIQEKRLEDWLRKANSSENEDIRTEYFIRAYRYPIGGGSYPLENGAPKAISPTELGNVIFGYETYPTVKYGVDGVFFWHRIWLSLDKDTKEDIDNEQALCDSAIYSSFSSVIGFIMFVIYAFIEYISDINFKIGDYDLNNYVIMVFFVLLSILSYIGAINANDQFGDRIRAMFDMNLDNLGIEKALAVITKKTGVEYPKEFDPDKIMAAWRFLRWHEYKEAPNSESKDIEDI